MTQALFLEASGARMQFIPSLAQALLQSPANELRTQRWLSPPHAATTIPGEDGGDGGGEGGDGVGEGEGGGGESAGGGEGGEGGGSDGGGGGGGGEGGVGEGEGGGGGSGGGGDGGEGGGGEGGGWLGEQGGGGLGEGGGGAGGGIGGGNGGGMGGAGGAGEGDDEQQASLHVGRSLLYFFRHIFVQILSFRLSPLHFLLTIFFSSLLHAFLQCFSDGAGAVPRARPPLISGSIFAVASKAASGVVDGATASTQLSTLRAASRHLQSGMLIIWGIMSGSNQHRIYRL